MGSIPNKCEITCGQYQSESQIEVIQEMQIKNSPQATESVTQGQTFSKKEQYLESLIDSPSGIKDEHQNSNLDPLPIFVRSKKYNLTSHRENRFMVDLEFEVKARIKQIHEEEQEFIRKYFEQLKSNEELNSKAQNTIAIQTAKPLPVKTKNEEISSLNQNPSSVKAQESFNTSKKRKAYQKLISEFMINNKESLSGTKGILIKRTTSMRQINSRSNSNKTSTHGKKKKVHFSQDTNFKAEQRSQKPKQTWWSIL